MGLINDVVARFWNSEGFIYALGESSIKGSLVGSKIVSVGSSSLKKK